MPKAATATAPKKSDDKVVSEAAFLKALDKKKTALAAAAKTKRPEGYQDDTAILQRLGLAIDESGTFNAQVSKVTFSFAKGDQNRPMVRFAFVIMSEDRKKNGTVVSWNHILEEGVSKKTNEVFRTYEEACENLMGDLQGLGEDTESWKESEVNKKIMEACKRHTKEKTEVSLYIKHWASYTESGKLKNEGANFRINGPIGDVEEAGEEDEEAPEDEEEVEEEDEETEEEGEEEAADEEEEEEGEFDPDEWIGGWVKFHDKKYGDIRMKVDSWDEDTQCFSGTDSNGDVWDGDYAVPLAKVDWDENQEDE